MIVRTIFFLKTLKHRVINFELTMNANGKIGIKYQLKKHLKEDITIKYKIKDIETNKLGLLLRWNRLYKKPRQNIKLKGKPNLKKIMLVGLMKRVWFEKRTYNNKRF